MSLFSSPKPEPSLELPEFRAWIGQRDCLLWNHDPCSCDGFLNVVTRRYATDVCHVRARRNNGDKANLVPLCHGHHMEQHRIGIKTFERKYGLNLRAIAKEVWNLYRSTQPGLDSE